MQQYVFHLPLSLSVNMCECCVCVCGGGGGGESCKDLQMCDIIMFDVPHQIYWPYIIICVCVYKAPDLALPSEVAIPSHQTFRGYVCPHLSYLDNGVWHPTWFNGIPFFCLLVCWIHHVSKCTYSSPLKQNGCTKAAVSREGNGVPESRWHQPRPGHIWQHAHQPDNQICQKVYRSRHLG